MYRGQKTQLLGPLT